jgi:arsenite methyltransferase
MTMAATPKTSRPPAKPDYGLDAPSVVRNMITRGIIIFLLGFGLWYMNRNGNAKGGAALFAVLGCIGAGFILTGLIMVWSSRSGKMGVRDRMMDALPWRGDEKVLDVGCGRGLMLVGAAKHLKTGGKVTGIDIWNAEDLSGNSAEAAIANARAEGVMDRVKIENGDARRLPYAANSFDIVMSSLALHNIPDASERAKALDEILRVAKPGGHIAIFDVFRTGDYMRHLEAAGAQIVQRSGTSFLWCIPSRWFIARKN